MGQHEARCGMSLCSQREPSCRRKPDRIEHAGDERKAACLQGFFDHPEGVAGFIGLGNQDAFR